MSQALRERFPPQVKYIVGNEGCERFSFYGMRSILVAYMVNTLHLPAHEAEWKHHLFLSAVYFMPLVGGWLADRFYGRYSVIFWLSLGYVAGHGCLALFEGEMGLYVGLGLIAIGAGGIKPNVSTFVGDQFGPGREHLMEKAYFAFYWSINMGSIAAEFAIPWLLAKWGPSVAFGVPGIAMAISLVLFVGGRKHYVRTPPTGPSPDSLWGVLTSPAQRQNRRVLAGVAAVFLPCIAFWMLYDQYSSSWFLQAEKLDLDIFGWKIEAAQFATVDPLLILIFVPAFAWAFGALERRGMRITALQKMGAGMFVTVLSFVCAALVEHSIVAHAQGSGPAPSILWQFWQYLFLAIGETLVSVTALEFAYSQAPKSLKSVVMALWFLTISLGNILTGYIAKANPFSGPGFFWVFAAAMLGASFVFAFIAKWYRLVPRAEAGAGTAAAAAA